MKTVLSGDFGVERRPEKLLAADGDDPAVLQPSQRLDPRPDLLDERGADEHRVHRRFAEDGHIEVRLERVELAAERVPPNDDVEAA